MKPSFHSQKRDNSSDGRSGQFLEKYVRNFNQILSNKSTFTASLERGDLTMGRNKVRFVHLDWVAG